MIPNSVDVGVVKGKEKRMREAEEVTKFATCSSDRTIRFWNFIDTTATSLRQAELGKGLQRNAYCKDLARIVFVEPSSLDANEP